VEKVLEQKGADRKEKSAALGRRMMRAEEETGNNSPLRRVSVFLGTGDRGDVVARDKEVENVQLIKDKREKKTLNIPESEIEEMDLESGEEEENFRKERRNDVRVEILQDILRVQDVGGLGPTIEVLLTTFLQGLMSDRMDIGEEYDLSVQEIVEDLEQPGREAGCPVPLPE